MATKKKQSAANKTDADATVTRIKATDGTKSAKKESKVTKDTGLALGDEIPKKRRNPLRAIGDYFAGAWYEIKQVRWPNRKATWSLTAAMLVFTAFFTALILLLDGAFKYLFEVILG